VHLLPGLNTNLLARYCCFRFASSGPTATAHLPVPLSNHGVPWLDYEAAVAAGALRCAACVRPVHTVSSTVVSPLV
jgi:hypothetical protein